MGKLVHLNPPAKTTLGYLRCEACEEPRDHFCAFCGELICITKRCTGKFALDQHPKHL